LVLGLFNDTVFFYLLKSRDRSVNKVITNWTVEAEDLFFRHRFQTKSTHTPIELTLGDYFLEIKQSWGVKRLGREAEGSPASTAEVKNAWSYTSTPPVRLHGLVLN
jgi:hypothetical protein